MPLSDELKQLVKGEVLDDEETLAKFSKDASIFEIRPQVIVAPKDSEDIKSLVKYVLEHPGQKLSLTCRSAGTCMSGGAINDGIILDMVKYFNRVLSVENGLGLTQPGVLYKDFEVQTLEKDLLLPPYTSSREWNTVGGMVANNSAGEKSLAFGQTEKYVNKLKVILSDGNEYIFEPLDKMSLDKKIAKNDFEGYIYKQIFNLVEENYDLIKSAKPKTTKNSTGYNLWDVWDKTTFDLTKLFVGSQGTLGVITEIEFKLIKPHHFSSLLVINLNDLTHLDQIVAHVLEQNPESFECYDDQTLNYAVKYLQDLAKDFKGQSTVSVYLQFLPEVFEYITHTLPHLVLMAEFTSDSEEELATRVKLSQSNLQNFGIPSKIFNVQSSEKYWMIRRDSFKLLKQHSVHSKASPFVDDIVVNPSVLPQFLPRLNAIFAKYTSLPKDKFVYTLAGHIGNGNFHIIPVMDLSDPAIRADVPQIAKEVFDLVFEFGGSMAAEHNDGLVRGQYLPRMYGENIFQLFKDVKYIFDPHNIFNPHKKTDATEQFSLDHMVSV